MILKSQNQGIQRDVANDLEIGSTIWEESIYVFMDVKAHEQGRSRNVVAI